MAQLTFNLNNRKPITDENKEYPIYLRYRVKHKGNYIVDFKASIKESILPRYFDSVDIVKNSKSVQNRNAILTEVANLKSAFREFDERNKKNRILPNHETVKQFYKGLTQIQVETPVQKVVNLFTFIDQFIERAKVDINPNTKKVLSKGTIDAYRGTKNALKRFNDKIYRINFESLNKTFYNDFIQFLQSTGAKPNYIGKHIKTTKIFVRGAINDEVIESSKFLNSDIVVLKEEVENIYLNTAELNKLWECDLKGKEYHEKVRDLFLIGCYTGLRVSDYNHLNNYNIIDVNGVLLVEVKTQKTDTFVSIPVNPVLKVILEKYNYSPPTIPSQKINECIKEIGEWSGIDNNEFIKVTTGGKTEVKKVMKFELIKSHTARRSFCSNAYLNDVPIADIMALSGHTSEKNLMNYIKVSAREKALKMAQHKHFN